MTRKRQMGLVAIFAASGVAALAVCNNNGQKLKEAANRAVQDHVESQFSLYWYCGTCLDGYQSLHISSSGACTFIWGKYDVDPSIDSKVLRKFWFRRVFQLSESELAQVAQSLNSMIRETESDYYEDRSLRDGNITVFVVKVGSIQRTITLNAFRHPACDRLMDELDYLLETISQYRDHSVAIEKRDEQPDMQVMRRFCPDFRPLPE